MTPHLPTDSIPAETSAQKADLVSLKDLWTPLVQNWRMLAALPLLAGILAYGATFLVKPTFTARTTFLPPQQQQSAAAAALSSLGALSNLAGSAAGLKSPSDQYVSLMQSVTAMDSIIDQFSLMKIYDKEFKFQARDELEKNVRILIGKKDGLITVEADAEDPQLAADIANQHVTELRSITSRLALTEAKQRRLFFEAQLDRTKKQLAAAQDSLQASGFNAGALNAEPKAAAEAYARLKAQVASTEVRVLAARRGLADSTPEVQVLSAQLEALRQQVKDIDRNVGTTGDSDYIKNYRDFKYQETLFELFAKQYELARLDESKDGSLIQVIDPATAPEAKTRPRRLRIAVATVAGAALLLGILSILRYRARQQPPKKPN